MGELKFYLKWKREQSGCLADLQVGKPVLREAACGPALLVAATHSPTFVKQVSTQLKP